MTRVGGVDAEALHVSPATVRRDLQALHDQRLLERTDGGAVAIGGLSALAHVRGGMSVAVPGGTTTTEVARALVRGEDLTIVSNAIAIAAEERDAIAAAGVAVEVV